MDRLQHGASQISQQAKGSSEPPLILLVEDNEMSIESMVAYLPVWGYRLIVARTGHEAVARAQQEKPDLILMDYQFPEVAGVTAVAALREGPAARSIPIVALTALVRHGDEARCLAAGFNACFSKPIHLRQLALLIDQLLAKDHHTPADQPKVKPTYV